MTPEWSDFIRAPFGQSGCPNEHRCPKGKPIRAEAPEWGSPIRATDPGSGNGEM